MDGERDTEPRSDAEATAVRWLSPSEQNAWRAYLAGSRLLEDAMDEDLRRHGLQFSEYEILALVSEAPGGHLRMSALADKVVQSRSRLTHTATRLERRGLVQRKPTPGDRRGVDLWLMPAGTELLDRMAPTHVDSVRRHFIDHLGPEGFVRLGEAMGRVRDGIRGEAPGSAGGLP